MMMTYFFHDSQYTFLSIYPLFKVSSSTDGNLVFFGSVFLVSFDNFFGSVPSHAKDILAWAPAINELI